MRQVLKLASVATLDSDYSDEDSDDFSEELLRDSSTRRVQDKWYIFRIFKFA